jgi:hypothetical protein
MLLLAAWSSGLLPTQILPVQHTSCSTHRWTVWWCGQFCVTQVDAVAVSLLLINANLNLRGWMSSISRDISHVYSVHLLHYKIMQMPDGGLITCPMNPTNIICTIFVQRVLTLHEKPSFKIVWLQCNVWIVLLFSHNLFCCKLKRIIWFKQSVHGW